MKLINVTNSYKQLVRKQLEHTDAYYVKVFSAGNTTVIYSIAEKHIELLIFNPKRALRKAETNEILAYFLKKLPKGAYDKQQLSTIEMKNITEVSIPLLTSLAL